MNHYETLGVTESATAEEIKRVYKKLARKWHPDVNRDNPDAEEEFKKISAAYAVLGDKAKRQEYDQQRKMGSSFQGGFEGFGGFDPFNMGGADPFDLFSKIRAARGGSNLNIQTALQISFLDAKENQVQPIRFNRTKACSPCKGTGAKEYQQGNCPTCRGQGSIAQNLGVLRANTVCNTCRGRGRLIKVNCPYCDKGSVNEIAEINVHIPAGILNGKTLRLQGEGNQGARAKGDLLIKINITPDSRWNRDGANVISDIEVDYPTLVLGGKVEVDTIWGKESVVIPEKTKAGVRLSLSNKGFPRLGRILPDERGAHFLNVSVKMPQGKISNKHKELLKQLKECLD